MRERAQSLGCDLRVKSEPGEGTCIGVDVAAKSVAAKTKEPTHADLKPIRILVVDDHFMVRMGLCASLNVESDMEVVAEVAPVRAQFDAYREHSPAAVIMDFDYPA